jgi:hypothetical protein
MAEVLGRWEGVAPVPAVGELFIDLQTRAPFVDGVDFGVTQNPSEQD